MNSSQAVDGRSLLRPLAGLPADEPGHLGSILVLTIRKAQMETFDLAVLRDFEEDMIGHLAQFKSKLFEIRGEPAFRQVVRLGHARAKAYGLTNRGPVRLFIELMVLFGCDFDTDPLLPWAWETLKDPGLGDQMARARALYRRSLDHRDRVVGSKDRALIACLRTLQKARLQGEYATVADQEPRVIAGLFSIYPEKCRQAGEDAVRRMVRRSFERSDRDGLTVEGRTLMVWLALVLGHGVGSDPLYPWVAQALQDPAIRSAEARVGRLEARARAYLGKAMAYLVEGDGDAD